MYNKSAVLAGGCGLVLAVGVVALRSEQNVYAYRDSENENIPADYAVNNARKMISEGRQTFRFDTFGDESFWGDTLELHDTVEGATFGGVGPGLSPRNALAIGLKVDIDAIRADSRTQLAVATDAPMLEHGQTITQQINRNNPAITLALLRANAVLGLTGFFNSSGGLRSIGIQCALCHSTVDDSVAPGIGHRLDGRANRDLNVGAIVALAPNLTPIADLLHVDVPTVQKSALSLGTRQVRRRAAS